jgi:hypothetical protein
MKKTLDKISLTNYYTAMRKVDSKINTCVRSNRKVRVGTVKLLSSFG